MKYRFWVYNILAVILLSLFFNHIWEVQVKEEYINNIEQYCKDRGYKKAENVDVHYTAYYIIDNESNITELSSAELDEISMEIEVRGRIKQ